MKKSNQDIDLVDDSKRISENIEKIAKVVYSVAIGKCKTHIKCCDKTYEGFLVEGTNIFDNNYHFDWYLFPCHCGSEDRLNFDPLENKYDAVFFLHFYKCFEKGPKYSESQIGNAPDIRMAICKKAIDQWFDPNRNETYWIRLVKILQHVDYTLRSLMVLKTPEAHQYFEFILKEICLPYFSDVTNDRYRKLYTYDKNFNDNIAFFNYLSQEFNSVQKSGIFNEKEILCKAYNNVFNNISNGEGRLKKGRFHVQKHDTAGKYFFRNLDKETSVNNKKRKLDEKNQETIKNQTSFNEIDITKENQKDKIGFWRHFLFGLFFVVTCFSLFLCFKFSLYFLILVAVFVACDLYLGFKNYFRGCCCIQKIETPVNDKDKNNLDKIRQSKREQNLVSNELDI